MSRMEYWEKMLMKIDGQTMNILSIAEDIMVKCGLEMDPEIGGTRKMWIMNGEECIIKATTTLKYDHKTS